MKRCNSQDRFQSRVWCIAKLHLGHNRSSQLIGGTSATPVHCANAKLEFAQVVLGEFDESVSIRSECSTQLLGSLPR